VLDAPLSGTPDDAGSALASLRANIAFERLLAEISARFLKLPVAEIDAAIVDSLRRIVAIVGADRAQLIDMSPTGDEARVTHSWAAPGVPVARLQGLRDRYPWILQQWRNGHAVATPHVADLPPLAAIDQASFQRAGVQSHLSVPLLVAGRISGVLALGCLRRQHDWPDTLVERMRVLADVFANALAHKRTRQALVTALRLERMASSILASLLRAPRAEQGSVVEAGLHDVAQAFHADRASLWLRMGEDGAFTRTHRWLSAAVTVPQNPGHSLSLPWVEARLDRGSVVRFSQAGDLPPAAAHDIDRLRSLDIRAAVVIPLRVSGSVVGALSLGSANEGHPWPPVLLKRTRLLGEVFASFLASQEAERREREAQAQAAHAARVGSMGVFSASLVHELTQPLAASLANAETAADLLAMPASDGAELRAVVTDIVADTRRAGELVQKLRRFLRHGETERVEIDMVGLLADVRRFVEGEAAAKGITLAHEVAGPMPGLVGDRVQIQQVVLNLLLNAFDAVAACAPGARRVTLLARPAAGGIAIEVADGGAGIDAATRDRIFQPFFTTKSGGMGLGLSISQTIVASHGGTISVRSDPGQGATFRVELPSRPSLPARAVEREEVPAGRADRVFVVDDDEAMCRAIERQLQAGGHRVETFESALDFLERAPRTDVACIVSDVRMPGMTGLDLQATLARAQRDWPIVFVSGHADIATSVQAMKAGAVAFLQKPFSKIELLAAVADALTRSRDRDQGRRQQATLLTCHRSLTPREREVFELVVDGLLNKVIADRLGISERTVKIHRGRVMEKMGADSVADLVRMAGRLASMA
jgi:FixJ family two-component response regulator/C4-dicarboxylate-specific signal transduction histidine kinase